MKNLFIKPNRTILLALYFDKQNPNKQIEVYLDYDLGGLSYISGDRHKRGYSIHVQPIEINHYESNGRNWTTRKMTAFTGVYKHLVETKAFSAPKMLQLAGRLTEGSWQDLLDHVIQKNNFITEDYALAEDE